MTALTRYACVGAILAASLALVLLAPTVAAQERGARLPGILVAEDDGAPVDVAVVSLVDGDGVVVWETLSNASGAFGLPMPPPGTYRVRVARIGYESWTSGPIRIDSAQSGPLRFEIPVRPVPLPELRVTEQNDCPTTPEERRLAFELYESVLPILATVSDTEDLGRLRMRLVRPVKEWRRGQFLYGYDTTTVVVPQSLSNASPGHLEAYGYAEALNDTLTTFYAPDGDALASPGFLATHCLSPAADDEGDAVDDAVAGLAFEPRPGREVVDVRGVLWIDTVAAEPRRLEFEYTSLRPFLRLYLEPALRVDLQSRYRRPRFQGTRLNESHFGGVLRFDQTDRAGWLVTEWRIARPVLLYELMTGVDGTSVTPVAYPLTASGEVLEIIRPEREESPVPTFTGPRPSLRSGPQLIGGGDPANTASCPACGSSGRRRRAHGRRGSARVTRCGARSGVWRFLRRCLRR